MQASNLGTAILMVRMPIDNISQDFANLQRFVQSEMEALKSNVGGIAASMFEGMGLSRLVPNSASRTTPFTSSWTPASTVSAICGRTSKRAWSMTSAAWPTFRSRATKSRRKCSAR